MIPPKIIRFMESQANIGFAGTRDRNLVPLGHRVTAWRVAPDGRTLTAMIPDEYGASLVDAMLDNGQIAVTVEDVASHETYQLKGQYLRHRPVTPDELELASQLRERFLKGLLSLYPEPKLVELMRPSVPPPAIAVDIDVREVFLQTPGPGAGGRIWPPPD
jgi:hypothetical protein